LTSITIDIDSNVINVEGHQEGATKGYNPKKLGNRCYNIQFAFYDELKAYVTGFVRSGNTYTANGASEMIKEIVATIKTDTLDILFRMDSGYFDDEVIVNQEKALEAYEKIVSNFYITESGNIIYPNEYGGEYIDKEILVIQLVDATTEMKEKYLDMCDYSENVRFENVEYSLNYLNSIYTYGDTLKNEYKKIGYGVDRKNNICVIVVTEKDKNMLSKHLSNKKSKLPIKIEVSDFESVSANVYGGMALDIDTLTCAGTYNGQAAILLCGHSGRGVGDSVFDSYNNNIGTVKVTNYGSTMIGDYAIATLNSGYSPTNYVKKSNTEFLPITGVTSTPVGTIVYRYGKNSGYSSGIVQTVNFTIYLTGIYFRELVQCEMDKFIIPGDSGGPVYTHFSSYNIAGTITGGTLVNGLAEEKLLYFSPISHAMNKGFFPKLD